MTSAHETSLALMVDAVLGSREGQRLRGMVETDPALLRPAGARVGRAEIAQALNLLLFHDLLRRVPVGALYVEEAARRGEGVIFDHGAVRTVALAAGALPAGHEAFGRILRPLGYEVAGVYPLDRLGMTGRAYCHRDFPETVAQFFVSELHPERFSTQFQAAVRRVLSSSAEPLTPWALTTLQSVQAEGSLPLEEAVRLLPELLAAFGRQHAVPSLSDYETLLAESREMAWIATEGNAFNHVTDRVPDVAACAELQKRLGRPLKEALEVSRSGRVVQTAYRAARVERPFVAADGSLVLRTVPGSFFELISRQADSTGKLDLGFDTGNAQGIFKMTEQAA